MVRRRLWLAERLWVSLLSSGAGGNHLSHNRPLSASQEHRLCRHYLMRSKILKMGR